MLGLVLCRAARLPTLIGFLLVGVIFGPNVLAAIRSSDEVSTAAEFGVVFLMFSLGLEFSLPKLFSMRRIVFGLGSAQLLATLLPVIGLTILAGHNWQAGLALGAALTMSSTAIVSKMLTDRREIMQPHGQNSIGILLFQDIAVVPFLILLPTLSGESGNPWHALLMAGLKITVVLLILFVFGQRLLRPWFKLVAKQRSSELFVINVLLFTLGTAWITEISGLSLALGAFLAGMLIAETEYRYQVEEDIKPFRDLLLGLFFVTVGMRLNFSVLYQQWLPILLLLLLLIPGKLLIMGGLARLLGHSPGVAARTGFALAQGGEFGFVLLALAASTGILPPALEQPALAAILLSMLAAPFLIQHADKLVLRFVASDWMSQAARLHQIAVKTMMTSDHVVICGYGRSGQSLARLLEQESIPFFALDLDPERVTEAAEAGDNVVFGDATRKDVLMAAGIMRARALIISYSDTRSALRILHTVREVRPDLPVVVRTLDETHIDRLKEAGAVEVVSEVMEGSLMLASHALMLLGVPLNRVLRRIRDVREQRYGLFRGFFHGVSDESLAISDHRQPRLHSVVLPEAASCIGKSLADLSLEKRRITLKAVRRNGQKTLQPEMSLILEAGDILVLLGTPDALAAGESYLLQGANRKRRPQEEEAPAQSADPAPDTPTESPEPPEKPSPQP